MQGKAKGITVALALLALSACTPFFTGGIVVFGPAEGEAAADVREG
jgi:hypothetical protein